MYYSETDVLRAEHNALVNAIENWDEFPPFAPKAIGIVLMTKELLKQEEAKN